MRKSFIFAALSAALLLTPSAAFARVTATVDLAKQRITIKKNGVFKYRWKISSGARNYSTPNGTFKPTWINPDHKSKEYEGAKMYHTVFFNSRGHAIHGTMSTWRLGSPASHGCVRLNRRNAKTFYNLVRKTGLKNVTIKIVGKTRFTTSKSRYAKKRSYKRKSRVAKRSTFSWNKNTRKQRKQKRSNRRRTSSAYDPYSNWF